MLIDYLYFNPTGNMTALVTSAVPFHMRKSAADAIMQTETGCEQVGFLSFEDGVRLDMTGGEFCGNASMCAGIAAFLKNKNSDAALQSADISIGICGSEYPVSVRQISAKDFECTLEAADVPEGIKHAVTECSEIIKINAEYEIRKCFEKYLPDAAVSGYDPSADARGLMFLSGTQLTPLVYVPQADTLFWENSCASGSMAAGKYLFEKIGKPVETDLQMPGGIINVKCDGSGIRLAEKIKLVAERSLFFDLPSAE